METLSRDVTWLRSDAFLKNHRSPDNLKRNCSKFSEATLFVSIPPYSLQPCPRSAQPVPVPPPCTARGSAAPLPSSHRGVHRALTVEDDTGTSSQGPRRPRVAFRTPRPVEALRIRLRAQPVPVPPSLHGTRLSRACATQPRGLQFARDRAI